MFQEIGHGEVPCDDTITYKIDIVANLIISDGQKPGFFQNPGSGSNPGLLIIDEEGKKEIDDYSVTISTNSTGSFLELQTFKICCFENWELAEGDWNLRYGNCKFQYR